MGQNGWAAIVLAAIPVAAVAFAAWRMTVIFRKDRTMTTTTEPDSEAAFLKWASTYTRVEEDRGRTTWDDMRAAFRAGRASVKGEALAAVREYRIYVDEDGDGIRMHGPCAETIGCLFGRLFDAYPSMREDIALGQVIDAALEHERDKERMHAAQMRSKFGTCMACGYPCACPDVEEAYAIAKAENDAAADLGPEA